MLTPDAARERYWRKTLCWVLSLLVVWFLCSLGAGVLFVDKLDEARFPGSGMKLGFWFAQQGSILIFLAILGVFVWIMNTLDRELMESVEAYNQSKSGEEPSDEC